MTKPSQKGSAGYSINWDEGPNAKDADNAETTSQYVALKRDLFSRYSDDALRVFMDNFELSFVEDNQLKPDQLNEALEMLQSLEEICWALDIQLAAKRHK